LGLALGYTMMLGLEAIVPAFTLPRDVTVTMDGRVLGFSLVLSVATGIVFGLARALQATSPDMSGTMREGGRGSAGDAGRRRLRSGLVIVEVALAFMLLASAGLLMRSFFRMMAVETGFDDTNVLTAYLPVPDDRFSNRAQLTAYYRQLVAHVDAVPGVRESAITNALPMDGWGLGLPFQIVGREKFDLATQQPCFFKMVSPSYFHALGMRVARGRGLSEHDVAGGLPATVINETMASLYFKEQDPIGQRILVREVVAGRPELGPEIPWEVVGVVADERVERLDSGPASGMYVSLDQDASTDVALVVRGNLEPTRLQHAITAAVHEVDKNQPLDRIRTLTQIKTESAAANRLRTMLLGVFAGLAVLLSGIGIYGVISYTVVQRTHEIGIRAALGANASALVRLVLTSGMALALTGLALGVAGSFAATRLLSSFLFGVGPHDLMTNVGAIFLLLIVSFLGCYLPARRAVSVDPLVALRES
jgi:putative ABC transport system permease protein